MIAFHQSTRAPTRRSRPSRCRAARRATSASSRSTTDGRIVAFHEKVENPPPHAGRRRHVPRVDGQLRLQARRRCCASSSEDDAPRGQPARLRPRHPAAHGAQGRQRVYAYDFATNVVPGEDEHNRGYWRDIGTIDAYWEAQMDLIEIHPQFNLYNFRWPIRTGATHDPPAKFVFRDEAQARVGIATDSHGQPRLHHLGRAHPPQRPRRRLPRQLVQRGRGERPLRARARRAARQDPPRASSTRTSRSRRAPSSASTARPTGSGSS